MYCKRVNITGFLLSSIKVFYKIKYSIFGCFCFDLMDQTNKIILNCLKLFFFYLFTKKKNEIT